MSRTKKILDHFFIGVKSTIAKYMPAFYPAIKFNKHLAILMVTAKCNLRCVMCNQWAEGVKEELSTHEWQNVMDDLRKLKIKEIHFTGGEPMLRKDIYDLITFAKKSGFVVGMTTNGTLLNRETIEKLIKSGLGSIGVSIDAVEEGYKKIRGADSYEKVRTAIEIIGEYKKKAKVIAYINYTLMKPSVGSFLNVKKVADDNNLPIAVCLLDDTPFFFQKSCNKDIFWLGGDSGEQLNSFIKTLYSEMKKNRKTLIVMPSAVRFIENYFKDPIQKNIPCVISQSRVFINAIGNVLGGCLSMQDFGNVRKTGISEIVKSVEYKKAHKNMFYKKCPGCSCGYLYNLQHDLPSVVYDVLKGTNGNAI